MTPYKKVGFFFTLHLDFLCFLLNYKQEKETRASSYYLMNSFPKTQLEVDVEKISKCLHIYCVKIMQF